MSWAAGRAPVAGASRPRVSVLLACRDGERHLGEALESLARQSWTPAEWLLVDDGSRDRTRAMFDAFARGRDAARVIGTPGLGLASALAIAAAEARGEFLARQDADDVSAPERFERQARFLIEHPDIGVVGTAATIIGDRGDVLGDEPVPIGADRIARTLRRGPPFIHGSVMMRTSVYRAAGGYRGTFRASQDLDLWLRLPPGTGLANLSERLYRWRLHPLGAFSSRRDEQLRFAALARAFAEERHARGADSLVEFERAAGWSEFLAAYPRADRFRRIYGELLVREGRVSEARAQLGQALASPRSAGAALWWLASWPAGWTPRARRVDSTATEPRP
jgi:glycosyltransferase involved in cell wall biosynthesis